MSHEIETMAYANAVPWHGLGTNIDASTPLEEWQVQAGLDWTVSKRPVQYSIPNMPADTPRRSTFKDKFVLARDTDDKPYSVVSNRYKPVQPKEILEFFRDLVANFGMTIETAGSLRDGKRVWAMAKTGDAHKVMGVDEIKGYCMIATSYDLTFSTMAYFTSVRVVCNNTLQYSFNDMENRISIPHFREFNIATVQAQMGMSKELWKGFTESMEVLAKIKLDAAKATEVMNKVFVLTNEPAEDAINKAHTAKVIDLFSGKGIGSDIAGQTGWGLVNSVTEYLDKYKRANSQSNRLDSAWFGDSFKLKQKAVDETLLLAA